MAGVAARKFYRLALFAFVAALPSFIFGFLIHANIFGLIGGFLCFVALLPKILNDRDNFWRDKIILIIAFRFAVAVRMMQSVTVLFSFLESKFLHASFMQWSATPDLLCGLLAATLVNRLTGLRPPDSNPVGLINMTSDFTASFLTTFTQGFLVLAAMLLTMLPVVAALALRRKITGLNRQ